MKNSINARRTVRGLLLVIAMLAWCSITAFGQATAFTYQGKLADSGTPTTGHYDFEFKLFDTAGAQQGSTVQRLNVSVANGIFTVSLDFGVCASCFNGAERFLEISVRPTGGGAFTTLGPRQPITSTPYALKSFNATTSDRLSVTCVNCVTSSQIQSVNGSAISGAIPVASVPAGSGNYIQNNPASQQAGNFNIDGSGTAGGTLSANTVNVNNALAGYNINGSRVLSSAGTSNLFAGVGAGQANTTGFQNSFFGVSAGYSNTTGQDNSFFGMYAGGANTNGSDNSFFGMHAGSANTTGHSNTFFGTRAGNNNDTGQRNAFFGSDAGGGNDNGVSNSFFGSDAGRSNRGGFNNSFFGVSAGFSNTTGDQNSFFGLGAGNFNTTGNSNTIIGNNADVGGDNLINSTAIGFRAQVDQNNSLVLGSISGINFCTAAINCDSVNVGIGTTTPGSKLMIAGSGVFNAAGAARVDLFNTTANVGYFQHVFNDGRWQLGTGSKQDFGGNERQRRHRHRSL